MSQEVIVPMNVSFILEVSSLGEEDWGRLQGKFGVVRLISLGNATCHYLSSKFTSNLSVPEISLLAAACGVFPAPALLEKPLPSQQQ